jgi:hypothetical protein
MKIFINDMIIFKGDAFLEKGIAASYNDILEGRESKSKGKPIVVRYVSEEQKFIVLDGMHRIVEGLLEGKTDFECDYDWTGKYSNLFWIPPKEQRFNLLELQTRIINE